MGHLKYYFQSHVCLSIRLLCVVRVCVRRLAPIPAGKSQDVTNKRSFICLRGDKNVLGATPEVPAAREPRIVSL